MPPFRSDGTLYFTDPPFGLPGMEHDPDRELPGGVYSVRDGVVRLETDELEGPNGLAFSPDERYLYVGDWDLSHKVVMRYELAGDGSLSNAEVFHDLTDAPGDDAIDGVKVDRAGNAYACGPGGVWVLSPSGDRLGLIELPEAPHNVAFGDDDAKTLYITALTGVYRIRLAVPGITPSNARARDPRRTDEQGPGTRPDVSGRHAARRERNEAPPLDAAGWRRDGAHGAREHPAEQPVRPDVAAEREGFAAAAA